MTSFNLLSQYFLTFLSFKQYKRWLLNSLWYYRETGRPVGVGEACRRRCEEARSGTRGRQSKLCLRASLNVLDVVEDAHDELSCELCDGE